MNKDEFQSIITKEIDLKEDIDSLTGIFSCITDIYLFGSRAYKTNSSRSDVDIILVCDDNIPTASLEEYRRNHEYLDIFTGDIKFFSVIYSETNGSKIVKKGLKTLPKQLDAIKLWSRKGGYKNESYYKQNVFQGQRFFPSARPYPVEFIQFKKMLNDQRLTEECQFYFQESMVDFANECFLSCVSVFGLACECIIEELVEKCSNKLRVDAPTVDWNNKYCDGKKSAKSKVLGLEKYFDDYKKSFGSVGFTELDISMRAFDVVRNYRNNADHPLGFNFDSDYCCAIFATMGIHLEKILSLLEYMRINY